MGKVELTFRGYDDEQVFEWIKDKVNGLTVGPKYELVTRTAERGIPFDPTFEIYQEKVLREKLSKQSKITFYAEDTSLGSDLDGMVFQLAEHQPVIWGGCRFRELWLEWEPGNVALEFIYWLVKEVFQEYDAQISYYDGLPLKLEDIKAKVNRGKA